jgi:hypothetical protein
VQARVVRKGEPPLVVLGLSARTAYLAHTAEVDLNPTTDAARTEHLVTTLTERMTILTRTLATWMQEQPHSLAEVEQHVVRLLKELGASLLAGLCSLAASPQPSPSLACSCGQQALYQRQRKAQVTTLLGPISIWRSYYLCRSCGHGQHPLDTQLQLCAGSRSPALDELLALLGATQDSFAQAALVLQRLTLLHISPNSVRDATEQLGTVLLAQQTHPEHDTTSHPEPPRLLQSAPQRLYISMDGVFAHLHQRGWSEFKVGCCYLTRSRPKPKQPEQVQIRAHSSSYVTSLAEARCFGWQLWEEAVRRGALEAQEVVVLGDGSHWIWNIADTHFPGATQIVDWYHASSYIWEAANALWAESDPRRGEWAKQQLDALWEGKVEQVLEELRRRQAGVEAVEAALSYYTTHQSRMDYAVYRARGMQIGSGSAESACKQLISARLKQAGMIWKADGAEAVAVVRAWLKSERWEEAIRLRPVRTRSYRRQQERAEAAGQGVSVNEEVSAGADEQEAGCRSVLPPEVLEALRAEEAHERANHPWRRAWSVRRQSELAAQSSVGAPTLAA